MKTVYKIGYSITAPRLRAVGSEDHPPSFLRFNGESKLIVWPKEGLQVAGESRFDNIFAFYNLAPGVLVYRDDLLVKCEEFFWLSREGTERLPLRCGKRTPHIDRKSTRLNSSHTEIYTLSLHDALPISSQSSSCGRRKVFKSLANPDLIIFLPFTTWHQECSFIETIFLSNVRSSFGCPERAPNGCLCGAAKELLT